MPHETLAILFLLACLAAPFVWAGIALSRSRFTLPQGILWVIALLFVRLLWRTSLPKHMPAGSEKGAVVICNHRSSIDPFFLQVCFDRPMHWMVAREYCESRAFGWFLRTCEVIPVSRSGSDMAATRGAIRYAQRGDLISMFPEGRINMTEKLLLPVRPGAIMVALRAKAPLLPCYIAGAPYAGTPASPFFMSARVRLQFGEVIDLSPYYDVEQNDALVKELMTRVVNEIARLAGQPDFQPEFAGRKWKPTEEQIQADLETLARSNRNNA
ncbi:MAG: 1-acyl-sn-glycerol-3-phosphate acyltransferase [Planctomycetaceae bacterium]|nr:1-acyl-sn-glycerol-3-phosphate acyltransferase [Planctomycetales bacterium]MCB9873978.1 1-acyl-sn-glycerol-3-phosphate acyltransferase [Planctomycetaceae bacterium]MCB9938559.1 1-acyl-sn-glycerol-3-phosphate acyltransferase [Planctomycetaceae bacterium]